MTSFPERQKTYGWLIATDTFLAGVGAGVFLISFILDLLGRYEPVAKIGTLSGPVLVLIGVFFLLAEQGRKTRSYRLLTSPSNPSSWILRGTWIMVTFIIFGLAYSLPSFEAFEWLPWSRTSVLGLGIGVLGALLAVLIAIYPGFLFGVVKGIPIWNSPILPPLFLCLSLYTGIAILLIMSLFLSTVVGASGFHQLAAAGIVLVLMQLLVLGAYVEIARHQGFAAMASLRLLKTPLFIGGAVIIGLLVPFGLLLGGVLVGESLSLSILVGVGSVFLLVGGLILRYGIIRAGVYLSLR